MRGLLPLLGLVACGPGGAPVDSGELPAVSLLEPAALLPVAEADDPLAAHRPDPLFCHEAAWGEEDGAFEVQTGVCDYAAFDQPLSAHLRRGDVLEIVVWHDSLDAVEPAAGHVAVWLGNRVLWDAEVAIPAASDQLEGTVTLDHSPEPDARLGVHLHNHGYNSWRFVAVDLHPTEDGR
jgi:hypothetical protein